MEQTFVSGQKETKNSPKKKKLFEVVKEHRKEIKIAVFVGIGVGVGFIIFKTITTANTQVIVEIVAEGLKTQGDAILISSKVGEVSHALNLPSNNLINVSEHLRNLPDGWKASQSKIDLAAQNGFSLVDHQTWVNSYAKTTA